jgi:threonylcarbamoyladenosine tRNA methylthiotransferase MtaB
METLAPPTSAPPSPVPTGLRGSVYVKTLGCKVNTFDSHAIENQLTGAGWTLTQEASRASAIVINTCSVTANADREARYLIRRLRRENPDSQLLVTGCYAQTDSARIAAMPEVDFVVPNEAKGHLVGLLGSPGSPRRALPENPEAKLPPDTSLVRENKQKHFKSALTLFDNASSASHTRAFLKIQDGCNGFCAYCLIPWARGASRSVAAGEVLGEVTRLVASGTREIVLTGIHIGDYGSEWAAGKTPFLELLEQIFRTEGLTRVRISSLEPGELSEDMLRLAARYPGKLCEHFHLPLQSGSSTVLKRMRRTYDADGYRAAVELVRKWMPRASIGADVIPGFPGETEEEFAETVAFIRSCKLSWLHVFPYSSRPNTAAARMPGHLPPEVVKERGRILRDLSAELGRTWTSSFIGETVDVLWENDLDPQGRRKGLTSHYIPVVDGTARAIRGEMSRVTLRGFVSDTALLGR